MLNDSSVFSQGARCKTDRLLRFLHLQAVLSNRHMRETSGRVLLVSLRSAVYVVKTVLINFLFITDDGQVQVDRGPP